MIRGDRMGRKEREKALERVNLLDLSPFRLASWEDEEGRVVVLRPEPVSRGIRGLLDRFFFRMSARRIRLDEVGSVAWRHLDGNRTVGQIAALLTDEFGSRVAPAEERLARLVRNLRDEGFLAYPGWDED